MLTKAHVRKWHELKRWLYRVLLAVALRLGGASTCKQCGSAFNSFWADMGMQPPTEGERCDICEDLLEVLSYDPCEHCWPWEYAVFPGWGIPACYDNTMAMTCLVDS